MSLTVEEVNELKAQLKEQIKNLPGEQRKQAEEQIDAMSADAIETMLRQQQARMQNPSAEGQQKTIFRMIIDKEVNAHIVEETKDALAVLDINPISKGHVIIIPKKAVVDNQTLPMEALALAERLSKIMIEKLKSKTTMIQSEQKFGEAVLHIIPIYNEPLNLSAPRQKSIPEELEELAKLLKPEQPKPKENPEPVKPKIQEPPLKMRRKVP